MWCEEACHVQDQQLNLLRSHTLGTIKPVYEDVRDRHKRFIHFVLLIRLVRGQPQARCIGRAAASLPYTPRAEPAQHGKPRQGMTPLSMLRGMAIISSCRGLFD